MDYRESHASEKNVANEAAQVSVDARRGTELMVENLEQVVETVEQAVSNVEGHSCFSSLSGYRELEEPHRSVHRHALEALAQNMGGNVDQVLEELQCMEEASMGVLSCLEDMAAAAEADISLLCTSG